MSTRGWIVAVVVIVLLIGLLAFARGRGRTGEEGSPSASTGISAIAA